MARVPTMSTRPRDAVLVVLLFLSGAGLLTLVAMAPESSASPAVAVSDPDTLHLASPEVSEHDTSVPVSPIPKPPPPPPPQVSDPDTLHLAPPTPAPSPTPAPPTPIPPPALADAGRCADPEFRSLATEIVKDCERACKKDESPLVDLSPGAFEALFGRSDDADVATHFSFFGCNRWSSDGTTCRGFDSAIADPTLCPRTSPTCKPDATALQSELVAFLERHKDAHTILLFGTASKAGNLANTMSPENARLAEDRATAVAELIHAWRRENNKRELRVLSVALDNTRTDYWQSARLRELVTAHTSARSPSHTTTFDAARPDAANRSVMVVAITCPGLR